MESNKRYSEHSVYIGSAHRPAVRAVGVLHHADEVELFPRRLLYI